MLQPAVELTDHRRGQKRDAQFAGEFEHQTQILLLQIDSEARLPIVIQNLRGALGEHPTAGRAGFHGAHRFPQIQTGRTPEHQCLADSEHVHYNQNLIEQFGHLAFTRGTHVRDARADGLQNRLGAQEILCNAAGHDRQRALRGAFAATGNRSIDKRDTALAETGGNGFGRLRTDRAAIDDQTAPRQSAYRRSIAGKEDLFDVDGIGDAEHQDRRRFTELVKRSGVFDAQRLRQFLRLAGRAVPDAYVVALGGQIAHHALAHDAEAHKSDSFSHR